jgi:hypothetical protein
MKPQIDTAVQWIYNHIRYVMRARQGRARTRVGRELQAATVESEWVGMCWDVGHSLVMMQAHGIPAGPVIESVSAKLLIEFPETADLEVGGFQRMRLFYLDYFERPHLLPKLRTISWASHVLIQERCRDPWQQEFYLELCVSRKLDRAGLEEAMKARAYELSATPGPRNGDTPNESGADGETTTLAGSGASEPAF